MSEVASRPLSEDLVHASQRVCQAIFAEALHHDSASPAIADLTYRGLRRWGCAQVRLKRLTVRAPKPIIQSLLSIAWAALAEKRRPDHVVVDETVKAAKQLSPTSEAAAVSGFVNALMRQTLKDPAAAQNDEINPIARFNAPDWWIRKIQSVYKGHADQVLAALCSRSPLTVRVAQGASVVPMFLEALTQAGLKGRVLGPSAVAIEPPIPVDRIPWFSSGQVSVQDAAAQWATTAFDELLQNHKDHVPQILDVCAAPGGKTIGLAQRYSANVWAMDNAAIRLERLQKDLARVQPTLRGVIRPVLADGLTPQNWPAALQDRLFDAVLIDAPCSASGVCRRHPEIAWRRTPEDLKRLTDIQARLLDIHWKKLKPGGHLLFVTCSIFPEEGERQEELFLQRTPDAVSLGFKGRILPECRPEDGLDQDGFYYAKFLKHA